MEKSRKELIEQICKVHDASDNWNKHRDTFMKFYKALDAVDDETCDIRISLNYLSNEELERWAKIFNEM